MFVYIACCPFCKKMKIGVKTYRGISIKCKSCGATGPIRNSTPVAIHAWNQSFKTLLSNSSIAIKFHAFLFTPPSSLSLINDYQTVQGSDQFLALEEILEEAHRLVVCET